MKGIVFSEFLEMVDEKFSMEMSERLIDDVNPPSGGAYTSLGTYDHQEIVALVSRLSEITSIPVPALLKTFGSYLLGQFAINFPEFFDGNTSTFDFLPRIESYVHLEVKKLYDDAELPSFICERTSPNILKMTYHSIRYLPDLAEGLIQGVADHFGDRIEIKRENSSEVPATEFFTIIKH